MAMNIFTEAFQQKEALIGLRRYLHQNAEIGLALPITTTRIAEELARLGVEFVQTGGGIKAVIGKDTGKRILLRGDMDALPIEEKTGLDYASKNGAMHACGHDLHASMLTGAAALLKKHEAELDGQVILMFQTGEETGEGAQAMIDAGVLSPLPDYAVAIHIAGFEEYPTGIISVNSGAVYASRDEFIVTVAGSGGHGAEPHKAKNPIYCAIRIIEALTDMTRYEIDAETPAVLTVCRIDAGTASNIIPETCRFSGTLRMANEDKRRTVRNRMNEIVAGVSRAYEMKGELRFGSSLPMLINDEEFSRQAYEWLSGGLEGAMIAPLDSHFSMGSDDFSLISDKVPSVYMYVLSQSPPGRHHPEHHDKVEFDDEAVPVGAAAYAQIALSYLKRQ